MVTGHIESVDSYNCVEQLYCRYSFSYGPDWEVVHGVSMGLSQVGRRGGAMLPCPHDDADGTGTAIVWNFPLDVAWSSTNPHGWPRLALSVYGIDFLGRDVAVGYASLLLPLGPGSYAKRLRLYRPVSGSRVVRFANWLLGTAPEYYDSRRVARGEGRAATRVASADDRAVRVTLNVALKDLTACGFVA